MLTDYCKNVLAAELSKPDYDGKTNAAAWSWLMEPTANPSVESWNGKYLTPAFVAGILGPVKANAIAGAMKQAFPFIADQLLAEGMNPTSPEVTAFLSQMVAATVLTEADIAAIHTATTTTTQVPPTPRRFDSRFTPDLWPHVNDDGTAGTAEDKAIHGFPNDIDRADFDAAWTAAGRN